VISANENVTPTELKRSLEVAFHQEGNQFMATIAQLWLEEGKQQALLTSIREGLAIRFSAGNESLLQEIEKIQDTTQLQRVLNLLFKVTSLAEFQAACRALLANENGAVNGAHLN
jgi:tRNA/tmRNA/rRNA uracil-C5-methylase (TrmA/RlmC/RlmD family)